MQETLNEKSALRVAKTYEYVCKGLVSISVISGRRQVRSKSNPSKYPIVKYLLGASLSVICVPQFEMHLLVEGLGQHDSSHADMKRCWWEATQENEDI
jgi:hypothetical protein